MTWREDAAPIIRQVIEDHPQASGPELMRCLREAYPFGEKRYHPYKIWRSEVRYQLGIDKRPKRSRLHIEPVGLGQGSLW